MLIRHLTKTCFYQQQQQAHIERVYRLRLNIRKQTTQGENDKIIETLRLKVIHTISASLQEITVMTPVWESSW